MKNPLSVIARSKATKQSSLQYIHLIAGWIAASAFGLLAMTILPSSAFAQETIPPECRLLPEHKASSGVAYQPGVDIHGKPVVPADVNAAPMGLDQQTIVVPLSVDLAQRLQNQNIQGLQMESTLGFLEIAPGGRVTYNGQDLTNQVHVLCGQKPAESVPPANGQTPPDTVK